MRVLHVLPTLAQEYGGPVRVAQAMCTCLVREGHTAEIYAPPATSESSARRRGYWPGIRGLRSLRSKILTADLVHVHGLWAVPTSAAAAWARASKRPFVITPHGMLDRWSLRHHALRKRLYSALIERRNLEAADALHFFNAEERDEARDYGVRVPTFLLPNGVHLDEFTGLPGREQLWHRYPSTRNQKVVLFLGRVHPKKGLPLLIEAFARLVPQQHDVKLVIVGPDEAGHAGEIAALIARHRLGEHVILGGAVGGEEKRLLLGTADVFVLPSYQEGDSVAVKEALACGLPVVITHACHFPRVAAADAGLVVNPVVDELLSALGTLCSDDSLRARMASNARALVEREYRWDTLGKQLIQRYEHVLARHGDRPISDGDAE